MATDRTGQVVALEDRRSPVDVARIPEPEARGGWHERRGPTEREPAGHIHAGVDLAGARGTPVMAPESGVVLDVGLLPARAPWTGYAPAVLIGGTSGRFHLLAHLSGAPGGGAGAPVVRVNDVVQLGQVLGYIGRERHAHWEVRTRARTRPARGELPSTITIDPAAWLRGEEVPVPAGPFPLDPRRLPMRQRRTARVLSRREAARVEALPWQSCSRSGRSADGGVEP